MNKLGHTCYNEHVSQFYYCLLNYLVSSTVFRWIQVTFIVTTLCPGRADQVRNLLLASNRIELSRTQVRGGVGQTSPISLPRKAPLYCPCLLNFCLPWL